MRLPGAQRYTLGPGRFRALPSLEVCRVPRNNLACTMTTVAVALAGAALPLLVALLLLRHASHLRAATPADEVHKIQTSDGWTLALHHYRGTVGPGSPPVLVCHGVAANHANIDLDAERSLARTLHARGRDVWMLDLRGCGASERPGLLSGRRGGYAFDTLAACDVPAAVQAVAKHAGTAELDWVGFSMGGVLAYAYFGSPEAAVAPTRLRRLVTIGSPVMLSTARSARTLVRLWKLISWMGRAPLETPAALFAWAAPWLNRLLPGLVSIPGATTSRLLRLAMARVVSDVSGGVARQFARWIERGCFDSADGKRDYTAGMKQVQAPALVVGGQADRIAHPRTVAGGYESLGSPCKRLLIVGRKHGHRQDYGHADLTFGRAAPEEVFEPVVQWLECEDPSALTDGDAPRASAVAA